jgi:putative hydrolase of HD superfamily
MKNLLSFLTKIGKLKRKKRRGWELRGVKDPETIAAHTFRVAIMAWVLGKRRKLNINKIIRMALIHDICEVYAGDTTPYDKILAKKSKKAWKEILNKWPRLSKRKKEKFFLEKYEKEKRALKKIISGLPPNLKKEIENLWNDYEKGLTREGRFVRQVDRLENLLQALEYWAKNRQFAIEPWWIQIEELIDDPILLEFIEAMLKKSHRKRK